MELLIGMIIELIATIVVPFLFLVFDFLFAVVAFVLQALFGFTLTRPKRSRGTTGSPPATTAPAKPFPRKLLLVLAGLSGGVFVAGLLAVAIANFFFFSQTTTWLAHKIGERTGIEIAFEDVEGSLFSGTLLVSGLKVERRNSDKTEYALTTKNVDLDVDVLSLIIGTPTVSRLSLTGIEGDIWTKAKSKGSQDATRDKERRRKRFDIENLEIAKARIDLHKPGIPSVTLGIDTLASAPFRSDYAVFDVFFRSNVAGDINGHKVLIETSGDDDGRITKWRLNDFPAELIGHYVDRAPFDWFERGTIDVAVDDAWSRGPTPDIEMEWSFTLKGVKVAKPDNVGLVERAVAAPVAGYINSRDDDITFKFHMVMNEEQFRFKPSLDAAGIWLAVLNGTAKVIAEKTDIGVDKAKTGIRNSIDKLKEMLDRKRKGTSEDAD